MSYTPGNPYGNQQGGYQQGAGAQSGYVQPQFGQAAGTWQAPGTIGGVRPWEQGPGGVPMAPMQQAPKPRNNKQAAVLPMDGRNYASAFRPLSKRWGRFLIGLGVALGMFLMSQAPSTILTFFLVSDSFTGTSDVNAAMDQLLTELMQSEWLLLVTNIGWGIMIAGSIATMAVYGKGAWRYLLSVAGKWRWGLTLKALGLFTVPFAIYIGVTLAMEEGLPWRFDPHWGLVFTVILLTPLQATGEEFLFRGVLTQKIGGWIPHQLVAALVSGGVTGFIFGAIHGHGFSIATFQLMCVGWACSLLTHRTGGLEAASVLHTLNNVFIMLPLALMGISALDPTMGGATSGTEVSPLAALATFGLALFALGSSYALAHFFLKKEQRLTVGAPGAEVLVAPAVPAYAQPVYGQPQYGRAPEGAPTYAPPPSAVAPVDYGPGASAAAGARDGAFTTREPDSEQTRNRWNPPAQ